MRRNAWVLLWALGVLALAATCALVPAVGGRLDPAQILAACAPLAVTLVLADDSVSYVTNFFLEHDPDDEDAPSMLGFTFRGIGIGAVAGLFVALIVSALVYALHGLASSGALPAAGLDGLGAALAAGGAAGAAATFFSFATTPIYLAILRRRDAANRETSGFTLTVASMVAAVVVFSAAVAVVAGVTGTAI